MQRFVKIELFVFWIHTSTTLRKSKGTEHSLCSCAVERMNSVIKYGCGLMSFSMALKCLEKLQCSTLCASANVTSFIRCYVFWKDERDLKKKKNTPSMAKAKSFKQKGLSVTCTHLLLKVLSSIQSTAFTRHVTQPKARTLPQGCLWHPRRFC